MSDKNLLVADDDPFIRDLVRTRLQQVGCAVLMARDGLEAIEVLRSKPVDGVILDVNMPKLDGFGVLAALRSAEPATRTPVLMLTARHAAEDVQRALKLGAKDYLSKPFTEQQLLARVARLLRVR